MFPSAESASTKEEARSVKDTLSRAIKDFRESQDYKNEVLKGGYISYCIRYENGRDAVKRLYPNLDLTSMVAPGSREETVEKTTPTKGAAPLHQRY